MVYKNDLRQSGNIQQFQEPHHQTLGESHIQVW